MNILSLLAQIPSATPLAAPAAEVVATSAGMTPAQYVFGFVYIVVCVLLVIAILSRTTKNEGLSGSMMGGGGGETSFRGAKSTDDTVDTITNTVAVAFVALSVALNYAF